MRILALNPYHGGSHKQVLDQWAARSEHEFECLTMPPRHFKWRIRQAAYGLSQRANDLDTKGQRFDVIFTTSMLDAAELRGFLSRRLRCLPLVVLFHENQFVYPSRRSDQRDVQYSFINWASALAADAVWFNSRFNQTSFLQGLKSLLSKMPDERCLDSLGAIREKSQVVHLGFEAPSFLPGEEKSGPLHIGWVGRWEHDKRPDLFLDALRNLKERAVPFRLSCLGQSFRSVPEEFHLLKTEFRENLLHFGFEESREDYFRKLQSMDVVVSTADHEFFGLALLEAVASGCVPVAPNRLVYPELYPSSCLYEGGSRELAHQLSMLAETKTRVGTLVALYESQNLGPASRKFEWKNRAPHFDQLLSEIANQPGNQ